MGLFDGLEQYRPQLPEEQGAQRSGLFSGLEQYRPKAPVRSRNLGFDFDKILSEEGTRPEIAEVFAGQESGWNPNAESVDAARGLFQVIPDTFKRFAKPGERYDNPADVARVGARMLAKFDRDYGGDIDRIAVAHFSGEGNVAPPGYATPWRNDTADGNGKRVSQYVPDIRKRLGQAPQGKGEIIPIDDPNPPASTAQVADSDWGEFSKAFIGGSIAQNPQRAGASLKALGHLLGSDNRVGAAMVSLGSEIESKNEEQAKEYAPKVAQFTDIGSWTDLKDYVTSSLGQALSSMWPVLAGAGVGGVVSGGNPIAVALGALGPSYTLNWGDVYSSVSADEDVQAQIKSGALTEKEVAAKSALLAVPISALDIVGAEVALGKIAPIKTLKGNLIARVGKSMLIKGGAEGTTEAFQQAIQEWGSEWLGVNTPAYEKFVNTVDAFFKGTLGGAAFGVKPIPGEKPAAKPGVELATGEQAAEQSGQPVAGTEGLGEVPQEQPETAGAAGVEQQQAEPPAVPELTPQAAQEELANIEASLLPGEPVPPELQARIAELQQATQDLAAAPQELVEQTPPAAEQAGATPPEAPPESAPTDPIAQAADAIRAEMGAEPVHEQRIADSLEDMTPSAIERVQAPETVEPPAVPESKAPDAEGSGNLPDMSALPDAGMVAAAPVEMAQQDLAPAAIEEQAPVALEQPQEQIAVAPESAQAVAPIDVQPPVSAPAVTTVPIPAAELPAPPKGRARKGQVMLRRQIEDASGQQYETSIPADTLLSRLDKQIDTLHKLLACVRA